MKKINFNFSCRNLIPIILVLFLFITASTVKSQDVSHPKLVGTGVFLGETPPLRDLPPITDFKQFDKDRARIREIIKQHEKEENNPGIRDKNYSDADNALPGKDDEVWQRAEKSIQAAPLIDQNFAGANAGSGVPTDCNGAVGPNHYMQTINSTYSIYNKTGTKLAGPTAMNTLFSGVTGAIYNDGDPIILYDDFADRWLAAEFSVSGTNDYMLVAVSSTNDPTGTWYKYSFDVADMPDYMKFGIWSDGYYMSTNNSTGNDVYVFQRSVMLTGAANPTMIGFDNANRPNSGFHCIQPLDADFYATPAGAPGMFITINDNAWGNTDALWIYELAANWTTPASSTFSRITTLATSAFDGNLGAGLANISQPGTTQKLDGISQVLMYRAQYINFGTYQTIVCCHTVDVDGTDHAGVRWYELRKAGGVWSIRQQGTYAPDANHRWMGSISMNKDHEIGLAYSISSPQAGSVYPGLKFTGQSATENGLASGTFDITETNIVTGGSSQTTADRWGDYSQMSVDPVDQSTFWFTSQYMKPGSALSTQVIAFHYPVTTDPPATDFYASNTTLYVGETTNFTDISTSVGPITNWTWTFEGGTPASSNVQNPTNIKYNVQGTYKVKLVTTNANGTTPLEKVGYITVLPGVRPVTIWCDDFSTPANWSIIANGYTDVWSIQTAAPTGTYSGPMGAIASTSGGNYALFDSDALGAAGDNQWTSITNATGINCSSYGVVNLTFQENYRKYYDSTLVYVSSDNFATSTRYVLHSTYANNDASGNPATVTLDISSAAAGKSSVKVRFTFRSTQNMNSQAGWGYAWEIDDVCLTGAPQGTTLPTANFSGTPRELQTGQSVNYTDLSSGATSWLWSFEGGTPSSSTLQNPTNIVYNTTGYYNVSLTAGNNNGTVTETKTDYVHVFYDCAFDESNAQDGDQVSYNYYDDPAITTEWGYIPGHNSANITTYADKVTVVGAPGKVKSLAVGVGTADVIGGTTNVTFTVWTDNAGVPGTVLTSKVVPVKELLAGSINYIDFTPVSVSSTFFVGFSINYPASLDTFACYISKGGLNRTNTAYVLDGTWQTYESRFGINASLYIFPEYCIDKPATNKPDVDFYADKTAIAVGGTVNFYDQSTGGPVPTAWSWTFPGVTPTTATVQNPASKTYSTAGIYDVTLQATNANGSNTKTKGGYIHVANTSNVVFWNFPNNPDNATADGGIALNTSQQISNWGGNTMTYATAGASTRSARVAAWDDANAAPSYAWSTTFTTVGYTNIKLSSKQSSTAGGPQNFSVYYSVNGGDFQFLATVPPITAASTWTQGVLNNIQMPADCDNQNSIEVVWYKTTDLSISNGAINATTGYSLIDDIYITGQICNTMPAAAGTITGTATVCQGQTGVAYSVPSITNATYYEWVLPAGATIASGQYTNSITVNFAINQAAGNISVYGVNMCGNGTASANYAVAVNNVPAQPGPITGSQTATNGQTNVNYSIAAVSGATNYTWTVPSFATIASGGTTVNPKLNFACPGSIGFISVHANNACGASQESYAMPITIACSPDADFYASTTQPCVGGSVTFTDASTNSPTSWSWSFTGGTPSTSNSQFPTVTYNTPGTYAVSLTATNANGSNVETKTGYIVCGNPALTTSTTSVSAPGSCDGSATVLPVGNSPFSYTWSTISKTFNGQAPAAVNEITTNNYTATVTGLGNLNGINYSLEEICVGITFDRNSDMALYLLSPDATSVLLSLKRGGTTVADGYASTCFNMSAATVISAATPPFTGSFRPEGDYATFNNGQTANGTWTFRIVENANQGVAGTLNSWSLKFNVVGTDVTNVNLCEGAYTVTVTDVNGCSSNSNATVTFASVLSSSITAQTNVNCFGQSTGTATVTATGGTTPYTYAWPASAGSQTTATATNLAAGTYTVTVSDATPSTSTATVTITQPASALSASITAQTNVNCFGNSTGSATVTASGGTAGYTYAWTGGGTAATKSSLAAGTYTVTVTDANSCTATASVTITQPAAALSVTISKNDVLCNGQATGSATANPAGGTGSPTYLWTGGATTASITNKLAGTYTVTVTDVNGCTATATTTITQPAIALSVSISKIDVACFGNSTGSATATGTGGTGAISYIWTGGATTATITNKPAGTYSVTATDANVCTATATTTIAQPASALSIALTSQTNVLCFGNSTGAIDITPSGGTPAYSYSWTGPSSYTASTQDLTTRPAGAYSVTVTDINSCTSNAAYTITQPATALSVTISKTDILCNGQITGSATATGTGGTGAISYVWTGGATTASITNKPAGTYSVTATDANVCTATATTTIAQPATALSVSISKTDVACFGGSTGSATATGTGGTGAISYIWTGGATTAAITNKPAGTYSVTATDFNGCTATATTTIAQPATALSVSVSKTDVTCFGNSTGSATATGTGGTGAISYLWTGGATTATITNKPAGTYSVTVTDANVCTATATTTITQPATGLTVSISKTDVACFGNSTGSATAIGTGGTGAIGYLWTGGATTASITNKPAGTYSVTATDASSCTATATTTILQPASALAANIIGSNVNCFGGSDGSANLVVTGGTPSNTYLWSNSATTEDLTGLSAGTFAVTVTDANSCIASASVTITEPSSALSALIVGTNLTCNGSANGTATLTVSGGTAGYTYLWSNGASTQNLSGISAGNYSVTVTDSKGCTKTAAVTITEPVSISLTMSKTDVTCNGTSTGTATVVASGGTPGYTYFWTGGATTSTMTAKPVGTYFVTVTDANNCTSVSSIAIAQPSALTASITAQTNVLCNGGNNGSATVTASGGTPGYTYLWTGGGTSITKSSLTAGTYTVTVTDTKSCTATVSATITQPLAALSASITTQVHVNCFGGNNGSATVTASGGTPGYTYLWTGGGTSATKNNLLAGTYTVTVTDNNACTTTTNVTITEPTSLSASTTKTNVTCNALCDGTASATVSGGTTPYSYAWSNLQTTQSITALCAGTFNLTVTDAKGCTITSSAVISEPSAIVITPTVNDATCGNPDGSASVSVSGGVMPYGYLWSNSSTVNNISSVLAGSYTVTVNDANGCSNTASADINDSGAPTANASSTNVTCNGACDGTAQVTAIGGTSPYTYTWSNSANTASITSLCNATYSVTVTDQMNCKATASVTITQPAILNASITGSTNVLCNGGNNGSATVTALGGTSPYTYSWSNTATAASVNGLNADVYTVTVLDSKSCSKSTAVTITEPSAISISSTVTDVLCNGGSTGTATLTVSGGTPSYSYNWTSGGSTATESNLAVGSYNVTVTDGNSCTNSTSVTINEPSALTAGVVSGNVSCNGINDGSVNLTVTGGTAAYSFLWSNSATTEDISGLSANSYNVTVTDANSCQTTASANISEPSALSANYTVTNVNCNGNTTGQVNVTVTGGTASYSYLWNNGATTEDLTGIGAGSYSLQITDANGCQTSVNATVSEPSAIVLTPSSNDATCGASNGSASVTVSGGTLPYTYLWSNSATSNSLSNVGAGSYNVTVTDGNSCTSATTIIINNAGAPSVSVVSVNNASCFGNADGDATINVTGGVTPYIYSWSNGGASASINGLVANNYTVTVTDAMGCTSLANLTVTEPAILNASISGTDVSCNGNASGSANLTVTGGTPAYSFNWTGGVTSEDLSGVIAGTYDVTVSDANGCSTTSSIIINEPYALSLSYIVTDENLGNDGAIDLTVVGGTAGYTFNWSNTASTEDLSGLAGGTYNVTVTDANGCTANASIVVNGITCGLTASIVGSDVSCNGGTTGSADLTVLGGTNNYTFIWSNGETTEDLSGIGAGNYTVTITDINSCTANASVTISEPALLVVTSSVTDANCGSSNGEISLVVTGGITPYSYLWNNAATTSIISNLGSGSYTFTVTDGNSCTLNQTVAVSDIGGATLSLASLNNVTCFGASDGDASVSVSAGVSPYNYLWSNGQVTVNLTGVAGGVYTLTVTDANSCQSAINVTITEPTALVASISGAILLCNGGNNGSADLTVTGGTTTYTYLWSNNATTEDLSSLSAGTYDVTVTDANACTALASIAITEPTAISLSTVVTDENLGNDGAIDLTVSGGTAGYVFNWSNGATTEDLTGLSGGTFTVTVTDANNCVNSTSAVVIGMGCNISAFANGTNVSCNGLADGTATVAVTGGTSPFTYNWSNTETAQNLTGIAAGNYSVTVIDANTCSATSSVFISDPTAISLSTVVTNENIGNDGAIDLTVSGGTSGYTFLWSNSAMTEDLSGLAAGSYSVTVTDANNCSSNITAIVNGVGCNITASISGTNVSCNAGNNGAVDLTITGGVSPISFNWSNFATTEDLTGLSAGTYSVTINDANACSTTSSIVISEPMVLSAVASSTPSNCGSSDGSVTVDVTGGVTPYTFVWSSGGTTQTVTGLSGGSYSVIVTDANGCGVYAATNVGYVGGPSMNFTTSDVTCYGLCNGMSSVSASGGTAPYSYLWSNGNTGMFAINVCAGVYTVTATDATGCQGTSSVTINEPAIINVAISSTDATCGNSDGSATANVTGGTAPYSYSWNTSDNTSVITNLASGSYSVSVTDANSCNGTGTVTINNSNAPVVTSIVSNPSCFGQCTGIASVSASAGTAPYTYIWEDNHTGQFAMNLCEGNYSVTATDATGCNTAYVVAITTPSEIILVMDSLNASSATATDGTASVVANGGTSPYTYNWNTGGSSSTITGLGIGVYTVTVTDANGCTSVSSIEVSFADAISASINGSEYINIYPNPSNGEFEILVSSKNNGQVTYKVYNTDGQVILINSLNKTTNVQNSKIDIRNNARGVYNVEVRTEKGVYQKRIILK